MAVASGAVAPDDTAALRARIKELEAEVRAYREHTCRMRRRIESLQLERAADARPVVLEFTLPFVPHSLKNGQQVLRKGRFNTVVCSDAAQADKEAMVPILERAMAKLPKRRPLLPDQCVGIEIEHNVADDTTTVRLRELGPKRKGKTGRRRDVMNLADIVCDALQRAQFYANDNQVEQCRLVRVHTD